MQKIVNREFTTLPPTLSQAEEWELLKKLSSNKENLQVKNKLIEGNYRLLLSIVNKYKDDNLEDLLNLGVIGMMKAVNTFELDKKMIFQIICLNVLKMNLLHIK